MGTIFAFMNSVQTNSLGGDDGDDEEMALGAPTEEEARDLKIHTLRCALRYRLFSKRQKRTDGKIDIQNKKISNLQIMIIVLTGLVLVTCPPAMKLWTMLGLF